jgi:hypothetical protein
VKFLGTEDTEGGENTEGKRVKQLVLGFASSGSVLSASSVLSV